MQWLECHGPVSPLPPTGRRPGHPDRPPRGRLFADGEPFFPVGFYYIYNTIRGEADHGSSPKGPNGRPPRTDKQSNASMWASADDWWRFYYDAGFNTFTLGWMGSAWLEGYGQMLEYLQTELGTGIMPILCAPWRSSAPPLEVPFSGLVDAAAAHPALPGLLAHVAGWTGPGTWATRRRLSTPTRPSARPRHPTRPRDSR